MPAIWNKGIQVLLTSAWWNGVYVGSYGAGDQSNKQRTAAVDQDQLARETELLGREYL